MLSTILIAEGLIIAVPSGAVNTAVLITSFDKPVIASTSCGVICVRPS